MYGIDDEINKTKRKFYRTLWLISVIATGVVIGNIISHSIISWNEERKLKIAMQDAEDKARIEWQKAQKELTEIQLRKKFSVDEAEKIRQKKYMDSLDKLAECNYWIEKSRAEKTSESMMERIRTCKAAGKAGY